MVNPLMIDRKVMQVSNNEDNQRVPITFYVTEAERDYLNEQADKLGLRRPALVYFLMNGLTGGYQRELTVQLTTPPIYMEEVAK